MEMPFRLFRPPPVGKAAQFCRTFFDVLFGLLVWTLYHWEFTVNRGLSFGRCRACGFFNSAFDAGAVFENTDLLSAFCVYN